jgi:membrane-bound lytic murein transglycosylase
VPSTRKRVQQHAHWKGRRGASCVAPKLWPNEEEPRRNSEVSDAQIGDSTMKRQLILCTSLLLLPACENSVKDQELKAAQAQREADEKTAKAQREANEKVIKAQNEANEKTAQATAEANRDIAKEQAKANEEIREANQDIVKKRNDYQVRTQKEINEIDNKIDDLKVKAQKSDNKAKAEFSDAMRQVDTKRAALDSDLRNIDKQAGPTFDSYKAKVDKEIDDLKKSIDVARQKL